MKKMSKLTKKLFLSAIALGLAVVTLTTTTFAWYTTSATASAGTGQAGTSTSTADSSLLISDGKKNDDGELVFGPKVTLPIVKDLNMIPLQWKDNSFVGKEADQVIEDNNYYEFTLYFKTTSAKSAKVYIQEITLTNTEELSALTKYDNLLGKGNNIAGAPTDDKYVVDVVKALDMVVTTGGTSVNYALDKMTKEITGYDGFDNGVDANVYYDSFMKTTNNETVQGATKYDKTLTLLELKKSEIGEVPTGTGTESVLQVTFAIYLNGWDKYCFDACKGQSFEVNIVFTTEGPESE